MSAKKIVSGIFSFLFVFLLFSCNMNMSDEMYYLQNKRTSSSDGGAVEMEIDESVDPSEIIPEGQYDPFRDPKWDINYGFDGNKIKDYVFKASFDNQNVPDYSFKKGSWQLQDQKMGKSYYNGSGDGNTAQGYAISPANFYRYDGYNPLTGKKGGRMDRFQFYAMLNSQSGGGAVTLNNYLIAIDTYSKLVFAYGKVTATRNVLGQDLPTSFDAVDKYGKKLKFYEYDPIGAVRMSGDNLEIRLYHEYKNEMRSGATRFFPSVHNENRAVATYENAGRSPYYYVEDLSSLPKFLQNVANKTFSSRAKNSYEYRTRYTGNEEIKYVTNGWDVIKTDWEFNSNGKSLTYVKNNEREGKREEKVYTFVSADENDENIAVYKDPDGNEEQFKIFSQMGMLYKGSDLVGNSSFVDPGADFILRVRGMKYVKVVNQNGRKTVVYEFSLDGGTLTTKNMTGREIGDAFSGSGTYYFVEQKAGNSASALYRWTGNSIKTPGIPIPIYTDPYFGVDLLEDGYKQIKRTRASSDKNAWDEDLGTFMGIFTSAKNYFSGESEVATRSNDSIDPDEITEADFLMQVAGLTFKNRPQVDYQYKNKDGNIVDAKGDGKILQEWAFNDDGKTLTLTTTDWDTNAKNYETCTFITGQTVTNMNSAKYMLKGEEKTVSYDYEKGTLTIGGSIVGYDVFTDRGPAFVLRVRNSTFRDGDALYVYDRYATLKYQKGSEKITYHFVKPHETWNDCGIYYEYTKILPPYWGIILDPVNGKNDYKMRMMGTGKMGAGSAGAIIWNRDDANNYIAVRTTAPLPSGQKVISINVRAKSFKNVNMVSKNAGVLWDSSEKTAYLIHVLRSAVFSTGEEERYNILSNTFNKYDTYGGGTAVGSGDNINPGDTRMLTNESMEYIIPLTDGKDIFIKLDTRFYLYAVKLGFIDAAITDPIKISDYNKPVVILKYNKNTDSIEFVKSENGNPTGTSGWSVKRGQTKDITLGFASTTEKWYVKDATGSAQAKAEATFEISFDIQTD